MRIAIARSRRRSAPVQILLFAIGVLLFGRIGNVAAASDSGRLVSQILDDIRTTQASIPRYGVDAQLNPLYRQQMSRELTPPLHRLVDLFGELEGVNPQEGQRVRTGKCVDLAQLTLYGDTNASKTLNDLAHSSSAADATMGTVGLMMSQWWSCASSGALAGMMSQLPPGVTQASSDQSAATQKAIVVRFTQLAKQNPTDDLLVTAALTMARYDSSSDELSDSLRDVVDHVLTGPAAVKYHHQLQKIGRPFTLRVNAIDGSTVSISDWKGKVVLIDFWATWCPPCRAALPDLIRLYQDNHANGLEVLGISNDNSLADLRAFLASNPEMAWPQNFNPTGPDRWNALSPEMGVNAIPTTFFIDRNGILREISDAGLKPELVKTLLDEKAKAESPVAVTPTLNAPSAPAMASNNVTSASQPPAVPTPPPPAPTDSEPQRLLRMAKLFVTNGNNDLAAAKLHKIISDYPNDPAAATAQQLLNQMPQQ